MVSSDHAVVPVQGFIVQEVSNNIKNRTIQNDMSQLGQLGGQAGKFYDWKNRYGKVNEHNSWIPRDHWLTSEEKQAILEFHGQNPLEGYRRLTFMMLDADVVAVSPVELGRRNSVQTVNVS